MEVLKKNADKLHQIYLIACLIAFILVCAGLFLFPRPIADNSVVTFAYADGWIREIAIWNLSMIIMIIYALRAKNEQFNIVITISIITISSFFAINHLVGMIIAQTLALVNLSITILNLISAVLGIGSLILIKLK
ncbi:MAG: hypothetical protein ACFFBP_04090 [Promethearchaeota archaeon]